MVSVGWTSLVLRTPSRPAESDCETFTDGFWGQPVNSVTSLAFVVAGVIILASSRSRDDARFGDDGPSRDNARRFRVTSRLIYGVLAVATGIGSVIFHGPAPSWSGPVHDLPLVALLAFVAVDAVSDVLGRRLSPLWWVVPTLATVTVAELIDDADGTRGGSVVQGLMAVVAVGAVLLRFRTRPRIRRTIFVSVAILGAGALIGTLSRSGAPLCYQDSIVQGHAVWHVLAAVAVWRLTPVVGRIGATSGSSPTG